MGEEGALSWPKAIRGKLNSGESEQLMWLPQGRYEEGKAKYSSTICNGPGWEATGCGGYPAL